MIYVPLFVLLSKSTGNHVEVEAIYRQPRLRGAVFLNMVAAFICAQFRPHASSVPGFGDAKTWFRDVEHFTEMK